MNDLGEFFEMGEGPNQRHLSPILLIFRFPKIFLYQLVVGKICTVSNPYCSIGNNVVFKFAIESIPSDLTHLLSCFFIAWFLTVK